jgi:hypothetical protein
MPDHRASELLYNTASSLRLIGAELSELAPRRAEHTAPAASSEPHILTDRGRSASDEMTSAHDTLEHVVTTMVDAARAVTSAIERAIKTIDSFERDGATATVQQSAALLNGVRVELRAMAGVMQMQDATTQQIRAMQASLAARATSTIFDR